VVVTVVCLILGACLSLELEVYDIALLAASLDTFGRYVYHRLTTDYSSYRSFQVYRYLEDAKEGEGQSMSIC
jgi:hypothetical protein